MKIIIQTQRAPSARPGGGAQLPGGVPGCEHPPCARIIKNRPEELRRCWHPHSVCRAHGKHLSKRSFVEHLHRVIAKAQRVQMFQHRHVWNLTPFAVATTPFPQAKSRHRHRYLLAAIMQAPCTQPAQPQNVSQIVVKQGATLKNSGCRDLNPGPLEPHSSALPS